MSSSLSFTGMGLRKATSTWHFGSIGQGCTDLRFDCCEFEEEVGELDKEHKAANLNSHLMIVIPSGGRSM